ncbi:hypothetical protein H6G27_14985 [Nostoc linckia FACHB-104]|nr:hypothetical protein [Nostoc linckia FACHB-104]
MTEIVYPTLDIFVYQLRNGLGDTDEQIKNNHSRFWQNLPEKIKVDLASETEADNPEYTKLLGLLNQGIKQNLSIKDNYYIQSFTDAQLEGYYYPVRLYDTYGLLFDCSINDRNHPQPMSAIKKLAAETATKKGNLGKSCMISGYFSSATKPDPEALANEAYQELANREWQNPEAGKFLGASLFEVWKAPQKWQSVEAENSHVLIVFYPNLWTMEVAAEFYGDWLRLLCARNKIIWEYCYSQQLTRNLQEEFKLITDKAKTIKSCYPSDKNGKLTQKQLQELQTILSNSISIVSEYATKLSYLEILKSAIETNLQAYQKYLVDIENKAKNKQKQDNQLGDTDLKCLESFIATVKQKYQVQVEQDHISLSVGLKVAEDLINTIRGIVEIEQAKRDRTLNNTIAIASVGLATSQIASAVILAAKPEPVNKLTGVEQASAFFLSLGIGVLGSLFILGILRIFRPK